MTHWMRLAVEIIAGLAFIVGAFFIVRALVPRRRSFTLRRGFRGFPRFRVPRFQFGPPEPVTSARTHSPPPRPKSAERDGDVHEERVEKTETEARARRTSRRSGRAAARRRKSDIATALLVVGIIFIGVAGVGGLVYLFVYLIGSSAHGASLGGFTMTWWEWAILAVVLLLTIFRKPVGTLFYSSPPPSGPAPGTTRTTTVVREVGGGSLGGFFEFVLKAFLVFGGLGLLLWAAGYTLRTMNPPPVYAAAPAAYVPVVQTVATPPRPPIIRMRLPPDTENDGLSNIAPWPASGGPWQFCRNKKPVLFADTDHPVTLFEVYPVSVADPASKTVYSIPLEAQNDSSGFFSGGEQYRNTTDTEIFLTIWFVPRDTPCGMPPGPPTMTL